MTAWLPVLKIALPYVSNIVAAAIPAFTRRKSEDAPDTVITQQIAELQEAVTSNAETVKVLAAQLEQTLTALAASEAESAQRSSRQLTDLRESVARCESAVNLAQAQTTRLDGVSAALLMRIEELELQCKLHRGGERRRDGLIAFVALLALILAVVALTR